MIITRRTTYFGTYWPSSGFLQENLWSYHTYRIFSNLVRTRI